MIKNYKYLGTAEQLLLHDLIISFFNRIEFERGEFDEKFFGASLGLLAKRHHKILKTRSSEIYNEIRNWQLIDRTILFNLIRESNDIEAICKGEYIPKLIDNNSVGLLKLAREFFIDLYDQVLDGNPFNEQYSTTLRQHFDDFSKLNFEITLCPICGIGELKKHTDETRDQYDHYLPKALYPFSSVNFKNLVPICKECNSFDAKGDKDIIKESTNNKLFFPYDDSHKGITIAFHIITDEIKPENIIWQINYTNPDNKIDEIESWKTIYSIDNRYKGFVNARIEKWYRHYWTYITDADLAKYSEDERKLFYKKWMEKDEECQLNFIRKPALIGFLTESVLSQAQIQAKLYSILPTT